MVKLSIIIPYYNTESMTDELLMVLERQVTKECEIILIDDGSMSPYVPYQESDVVKVYRQENKGVSAARNNGLKHAKGEYIVFIDSDDLVTDDYIEKIFQAIALNPDTVYISWRSLDRRLGKVIQSESDEFNPWNRCVWNRVFKKTYIKGLKFDESLMVAEDDDFLKHLPEPKSKAYIPKQIYLYRAGRSDGLTQRKINGDFLPDGRAKPEKPRIKTQVVVYCANMQKIGGIETWLFYWCQNMKDDYDIMIVFRDNMDGRQIARLSKIVRVYKLMNVGIDCEVLINTRITDEIPKQIRAKRIIQMVHGCYSALFCCDIQPNRDTVVCVSEVVAKSYTNLKDYKVIHNFLSTEEPKPCLFLITASRFTREKGGERMLKLASALKKAEIPFIWFVFSHQDTELVEGMIKMPETMDVRSFIQKCDYLVQLSDSEGFGYSIVEALEMGIPVITTPVEVLGELKFRDGIDGYIVPFDMVDIQPERFLNIPTLTEYSGTNNETIRKQWKQLIGRMKPTHSYTTENAMIQIQLLENVGDLELGRELKQGEEVTMRRDRALMWVNLGKAVITK